MNLILAILALVLVSSNLAALPSADSRAQASSAAQPASPASSGSAVLRPTSAPSQKAPDRIEAGDRLEIRIHRFEDLSGTFGVQENGSIKYPLLGEIYLSGLTVAEATEKIRSGLGAKYVVEPQVLVQIKETHPKTRSEEPLRDPTSAFRAENLRTQDFRKVTWGSSPEAVKAAETGKPKHSIDRDGKSLLIYTDTVSGLDCEVLYIFVSEKLVRAKYVVTATHSNKTAYLADFDTLLTGLKNKYGPPKKDDTFWKNDLYKEDPSNWGLAVAVGHLSKYTGWETSRSSIILVLTGDNYTIDLEIEYSSQELGSLEKKQKDAVENEKL